MDWDVNDLCGLLSLSFGIPNRLLDGISFYLVFFFPFFFFLSKKTYERDLM